MNQSKAQKELQRGIAFTVLGIVLAAVVPGAALAGGADVSTDEIYSDGITLLMENGDPLDINGDGNVDLAVASNRGGTDERSRYYLGNGDGTFSAGDVLTGGPSSEVVAGDMNGDTFLDLVQGRRDLVSQLHLGDSFGGFLPDVDVSPDTNRVLDVAMGDLDGDTDLDIVMASGRPGGIPANPPQANRFYLNDGLGAFTGADISGDLDDTRSIELGDMDGDGDLDVIVGNDETTLGSNRVYLNQSIPSGTVSFAAGVDFGPDNDQTSKVLIGDLNDDGLLDIVALNHVSAVSPGTNRFFLNETAGTFAMGAEQSVSADLDNTGGGVLADFDGDGDLDIAVANLIAAAPASSRNRLYLNQFIETGTVSFAAGVDISADEHMSRSMTAADINGDTFIDIVVGNQDDVIGVSGRDRRYLNNGTPTPFTVAFTSTPVAAATEGVAYTYDITTTAPDVGETIVITDVTVPAWLTFTDNGDGTASLTGTPTAAELGDHGVSLEVSDGSVTATQDFTVTVSAATPGNNPPSFTSTAVEAATVDVAYSYSITVTDPDAGDTLTITAPTVPAWLTLTDNGDGTATLTGTPTAAEVGVHNVSLLVSDAAAATATQDFTVTVSAEPPANELPEFTSTAVVDATEGTTYTYDVTATDGDTGATLVITAPTLPAWLELMDNGDGTATLTGTPAAADVGSHEVSLEVSDGTDSATQDFTIAVEEANTPPPPPSGGGGGGGSLGFLSLLALGMFGAARTRRRML